MGMESVVYGFIQGPHWPHEDAHNYDPGQELNQLQRRYMEIDQKLREKVRFNLHAISTLPEDDAWPFLSRAMFSSSTHSIQTTYKSQIIHFGASFKQIEWDWEEWLTKFEALLRKMYWDEIHLHLLAEWLNFSPIHYIWKDEGQATSPDHPHPVARWTFLGGPRSFHE